MEQETNESLRDALEQTWDSLESGEEGAEHGAKIPELDDPPTEGGDAPLVKADNDKSPTSDSGDRDGKGRFKKKEAAEASAEMPMQGKEAKGKEVEAKADPIDTPVIPPISWKKEEQEAFRALPKQVQETISRREKEREVAWNRGQMEISQYKKRYSDIDSALAPHENKWARAGIQPGQVIKQFLAWQERLDQDPKAGIAELAATYGIDPSSLSQSTSAVDPKFSSLEAEIQRLRSEITSRSQYEDQAYQQQIEGAIGAYATERATDGKPLRPYFNDVYPDMLPIAEALRRANPNASPTEILDAAYDRAVYANPATRAAMIAERTKQEEAKRITEAKDKTNRAKLASSPLSNGTPGTLSSGGPKSIRESLLQTWDELT